MFFVSQPIKTNNFAIIIPLFFKKFLPIRKAPVSSRYRDFTIIGYTKQNVFVFRSVWSCVYPSFYGSEPPVSTRITVSQVLASLNFINKT